MAEEGLPDRRISNSSGRQPTVGGCCDHISNRYWTCWLEFPILAADRGRNTSFPHVLLFSILAHRDRLQLVSRHRHLHRCPSPQAERDIRPEVAPCARRTPRYAISSKGLIQPTSRWSSGNMQSGFRRHAQHPETTVSRWMARRCVAASTISTIVLPPRVLSRVSPSIRHSVLAHVDIAEKSNEIPAAQALLAELGVPGQRNRHTRCDTLSKKPSTRRPAEPGHRTDHSGQEQPTKPCTKIFVDLSAVAAPLQLSTIAMTRLRNRDETRTVCVFEPGGKLDDRDWQGHATRPSSVSSVSSTPATAATGC